jgi:hypothetical protein
MLFVVLYEKEACEITSGASVERKVVACYEGESLRRVVCTLGVRISSCEDAQ